MLSILLKAKPGGQAPPAMYMAARGLMLFFACFAVPFAQARFSIKLKGEQTFEKNKNFEGLKVGGLSGLAFEESSGYFYALSDDKTNYRIYKLALSQNPHYTFKIKEQIFLKNPKRGLLKRNMDPEALAFYGDDKIFIASEGQQTYKKHDPTQIFTFDRQAVLREAWPVPPVFWRQGPDGRRARDFGQQENKGFESLALDKAGGALWTATEKPLKQDLAFNGQAFVRLSAFDIQSKKMLDQRAYPLHDPAGGLTALQLLEPGLFISLERVYKRQKKNGVNEVYVFLADCRKASNVQSQIQLRKGFKACSKSRLWDSAQTPEIRVDNLEAMALGPTLPLTAKARNADWPVAQPLPAMAPAWPLGAKGRSGPFQLASQTKDLALGKSAPAKNLASKPANKESAAAVKKQLLVLASDNNFNEEKQKSQFLFFELSR